MDTLDSRTEQLLAELEEEFFHRQAKGRRISRREILRFGSGTAVVSAIGIGGLMELLANREAVAFPVVIGIVGVTRLPSQTEVPHRHGFVANFFANVDRSKGTIMGSVSGRTVSTISTTSETEEAHFHIIRASSVSLEQVPESGPENNESGGHTHGVSIE